MVRHQKETRKEGRTASRWFLFLTFYHLLPMPWYLAVAAGLAPASFLMMLGLASLFNGDFDSMAFAALFLAAALFAGLVIGVIALLVAWGVGWLRTPFYRTSAHILLLVACLFAAMQPIYITGHHNGEDSFSLFDFISIFEQFRIPAVVPSTYFALLSLLLLLLLCWQHSPKRFPVISRKTWAISLVIMAASLIIALGWFHRYTLFVYPLAELGFASQQYRLALMIKESPRQGFGANTGYRNWMERAAEQGHLDAAMELIANPRSAEEKARWLEVAAEGGHPSALYELYLLKKSENNPNRLQLLIRAAEGGSAEAQYQLGLLFARGQERFGLKRDPSQAHKWWLRAASQDHGPAMRALVPHFELGLGEAKRDPEKAAALLRKVADGYEQGTRGLTQNATMAASLREHAVRIEQLEQRLQRGDPEAQATLARKLLDTRDAGLNARQKGLDYMAQAAEQGNAELQYELGAIHMYGRHELPKDLAKGRLWWDRAAGQGHPKAMESLAKATQNGQFEYPVDLLRSKALTERLVTLYRDGNDNIDPDPDKHAYWSAELKHFDRLFEIAGGDYQPIAGLKAKADTGDASATYQLGRQLLVSGSREDHARGYALIEQAADTGYAEAQYRLVTRYENHLHILRDDPQRGLGYLRASAAQNHLPAIGEIALAYYKGRHGLPRDYRQAKKWYDRLFAVYETGDYLGDIDDRFINFQRRQLGYTEKSLVTQVARENRLANASPFELKVIAIEDRYHKEYEKAVNALDRGNGSREAKALFREEVQRLRGHYAELRDREIERFKQTSGVE